MKFRELVEKVMDIENRVIEKDPELSKARMLGLLVEELEDVPVRKSDLAFILDKISYVLLDLEEGELRGRSSLTRLLEVLAYDTEFSDWDAEIVLLLIVALNMFFSGHILRSGFKPRVEV